MTTDDHVQMFLDLPVLCVVIVSSSALIMPRATTTPGQNTPHTEPNHMDQVAVDSQQARAVFQELTRGNAVLKMQDLERFLNSSDTNDDGQVTSDEFLETWFEHKVGPLVNAVPFFFNIDVNKDNKITDDVDLKYIYGIFDRNDDGVVDEAEFVVQWVKLSTL